MLYTMLSHGCYDAVLYCGIILHLSMQRYIICRLFVVMRLNGHYRTTDRTSVTVRRPFVPVALSGEGLQGLFLVLRTVHYRYFHLSGAVFFAAAFLWRARVSARALLAFLQDGLLFCLLFASCCFCFAL
jgi:hypothetical protein